MKNVNFRKDLLPHLIAIAVFLIVTAIFFSPIIFEGKSLQMHDMTQGISGGKEANDFRVATGEEALWTNSMFSGMPTYMVNTDWGDAPIKGIFSALSLFLPSIPAHTFLSFFCFYLMLLSFRVSTPVAIAASLAFGLSTFMLISIEAGHIWKVRAIVFMPLVICGTQLLFGLRKTILGFAVLATALTLELYANHLQITYYLTLLLLIYAGFLVTDYIKSGNIKQLVTNSSLVFLAIIISVGCNFGRIYNSYSYSQYSSRGPSELTTQNTGTSGLDKEYVFNWSHGIMESFTFLIPNFSGGASIQSLEDDSNVAKALTAKGMQRGQMRQQIKSMPTYWGNQPFVSGPIYFGSIAIFMLVIGLFYGDRKILYWAVSGIVLSCFLAWGKNFAFFNDLMYSYFPGYDKFRSVSMAIVLAVLLIPFVGALGLDRLLDRKWDQATKKSLLIAFGSTAGLALLLFLLGGMFSFKGQGDASLPEWLLGPIEDDRKSLLKSDALRSFAFIALAAGILVAILLGKLKRELGIGLIALLIALDLGMVNNRYFETENYKKDRGIENLVPKTNADLVIENGKGLHSRVLNLQNPWNETTTSFYHSSIGGYHGAKMKRYEQLIEQSLNTEVQSVITSLQAGSQSFTGIDRLNMLNTKFFKFGPEQNNVLQNSSSFGNAWLVSQVEMASSPNDEIAKTSSSTDLKNTAVIDQSKFSIDQSYSGSGNISLKSYAPNKMVYDATISDGKGLAVFSEIYYPEGWTATIDGNSVEIIRSNFVLRALEIPEGAHEIQFTFAPESYFLGRKVSLIFSILLLGMILFALYSSLKAAKNEKVDSEAELS